MKGQTVEPSVFSMISVLYSNRDGGKSTHLSTLIDRFTDDLVLVFTPLQMNSIYQLYAYHTCQVKVVKIRDMLLQVPCTSVVCQCVRGSTVSPH